MQQTQPGRPRFSLYSTCPVFLAEHWLHACQGDVIILHGQFCDGNLRVTADWIADLDAHLRTADKWLRTEIGGHRVDDWQRNYRRGPFSYCGHAEPTAHLYLLRLCRDYRDDLRHMWRYFGWEKDTCPPEDFWVKLDPGAVAQDYRRLHLACLAAPEHGPPGTLPNLAPVLAEMAHERTRTQIRLHRRRVRVRVRIDGGEAAVEPDERYAMPDAAPVNNPDDDDLLDACESYWLDDTNRLFRWLRSHECNAYVMGHGAKLIDTLPPMPPPEAMIEAMGAAERIAYHVLNEPPNHLTEQEQKVLGALVTAVITSVQQQRMRLAVTIDGVRTAKKEYAAGLEALQPAAAETLAESANLDGPSFAKAIVIQALQNDGKGGDGKRLTAAGLWRQLQAAGVNVTRQALYENDDYKGVRALSKSLNLFGKLPERRGVKDAARRGSKDKATGKIEATDSREQPPDQIAR